MLVGKHAGRILNNAPAGKLLGIDLDADAIASAGETLTAFGERVTLVQGNFSELASIAGESGFERADGVLFDLGFSSMQLDEMCLRPSMGWGRVWW